MNRITIQVERIENGWLVGCGDDVVFETRPEYVLDHLVRLANGFVDELMKREVG